MSTSSRSDSDSSSSSSSLDVEGLLQIGERCRELRKEKDMLKASQSQSYDLIKRLELHVKRLNEARTADKRHIQELERELSNCYDEIESLQGQLSARNAEVDTLGKHVDSLNVKLANMGGLEDEVIRLTEGLQQSNMEVLYLKEQVENKELELKDSTLCVQKLEETINSTALEYECEIESLKLEMLSLEQSSLEAKRFEEESIQEKTQMRELIDQFKFQNEDACGIIETLEQENNEMKHMLDASQTQVKLFVKRVEEHFKELLEKVENVQGNLTSDFGQHGNKSAISEASMCGEVLGPLLVKLLSLQILHPDSVVAEKTSRQIHEYALLVKKLKEEVKKEKLKAKDEAEDLAQEMAELRYHTTELLEEERKRRSCIEQASLQRIADLETQLQIERKKVVKSISQTD